MVCCSYEYYSGNIPIPSLIEYTYGMYVAQSLIYLPIVVGILVIAALTYFRRASRGLAKFSLFSVVIASWVGVQGLAQLNTSPSNNLIFVRASSALSLLVGFTFYLFIFDYLALKKSKTFMWIAYGVIGVLVVLNFTEGVIQKASVSSGGISVDQATIIYSLQLVLVAILLVFSIFKLYRASTRDNTTNRLKNNLMIFAFLQAAIFSVGASVLFPTDTTSQYAIIGSVFMMVLIITYAIVRHRLFDIRAVVARSVSYLLIVATISGVYGLTAFVVVGGSIFKSNQLSLGQEIFYAGLAVVLAFTFQPIHRFFQRVTDKIFYRDKYDAQELINAVGRILTAEIRLNVLTKEVTSVISKQMRVNKVDIVVVNDKNIYYQARVLRSDRSELELKDLQELGKPMLVADDMGTGDRKDIMDKYGLRVSITLRTSEEFVGYLLLGEKLSGDIYNEQDLAVLRIIANELAVAVQNAKAYTEIQQFNKTLQAKVVAATRKLRKANDDLKELDQAKDEFISMASHQLRTPLTTAKGYVSMVLEGDFGKINPAMKEPLTQSLDSANRMAGLVSDLLNVSRMEAGRFFIDPVEVDLGEEVPAEITQLQTMADSKNVKLVYKKPAKAVPKMQLDLDKTRQVIMNLVDNAIHYSAPPSGGGKVEVSLAQEGEDIVFTVVDNGIGVPEAQQKKLFKKFFRAANAQNTRPDGTGLGLYLVKRVIEDQGGEVIFESKEGKGSTFGFRIPVHNKIKPNSKAAQRLASGDTQPSPDQSEAKVKSA